jgi:hypothetical protein
MRRILPRPLRMHGPSANLRQVTTSAAPEPDSFNLIIRTEFERSPDEQISLFKSVGASYDGSTQTWYLPLEHALTGDRPGIDALFESAQKYGTSVRIEPRKSPAT